MTADVSVVAYGLGNVLAIRNSLARSGLTVELARTSSDVRNARRLILPGVGAFGRAVQRLQASGMLDEVYRRCCDSTTPVLGICVGMQMMASWSDEGEAQGLGIFDASVKLLPWQIHQGEKYAPGMQRVPHIGWNRIHVDSDAPIFHGLHEPQFYFLHSYYWPSDSNGETLARTNYGISFASVVGRGSTFGVQFHPEKSHHWGEKLLWNFATL